MSVAKKNGGIHGQNTRLERDDGSADQCANDRNNQTGTV